MVWAMTMEELAGDEEVLQVMVSHIKELSEDERLRQQMQAREDYERRLKGQYSYGYKQGIEQGIERGIGNCIIMMLENGKTVEEIIKDFGGNSSELVHEVYKEWKK